MKATISSRHMFGSGLLALALAGVLGATIWIWQDLRLELLNRGEPGLQGLQVFGTLPDFSLIERGGRRVTLGELQGKVWIANFIYTNCTDTCPLQSARMAKLQGELSGEPDLRLVSITVDPERDSPRVLAEYADRFGADRDRWLFLTGQKQALYALAQQGFRLSVEEPEKQGPAGRPGGGRRRSDQKAEGPREPSDGSMLLLLSGLLGPRPAMARSEFLVPPFLHSSWFVLVDRQARIRGYYRSDDEANLRHLLRDARTLLRGERS